MVPMIPCGETAWMWMHSDSSGDARNILSLEHKKFICQLALGCTELMKDSVYLLCIASYGD